jgi:hypothetical protein
MPVWLSSLCQKAIQSDESIKWLSEIPQSNQPKLISLIFNAAQVKQSPGFSKVSTMDLALTKSGSVKAINLTIFPWSEGFTVEDFRELKKNYTDISNIVVSKGGKHIIDRNEPDLKDYIRLRRSDVPAPPTMGTGPLREYFRCHSAEQLKDLLQTIKNRIPEDIFVELCTEDSCPEMKIDPSQESISYSLYPVSAIVYFKETLEFLDQSEFSQDYLSQVAVHLIRIFSHFYTHHNYEGLSYSAKKRLNNAFKCVVSFVEVNHITPDEDLKFILDWYRSIRARTTNEDFSVLIIN